MPRYSQMDLAHVEFTGFFITFTWVLVFCFT